MIDEQVMMMMKRMFKAQDKFMKLINRINKLPDAQRKKLEAVNLIGPKYDKEMAGLISEYKEMKKQFKEIEKQKSPYEGKTVEEIKDRMIFGKIEP